MHFRETRRRAVQRPACFVSLTLGRSACTGLNDDPCIRPFWSALPWSRNRGTVAHLLGFQLGRQSPTALGLRATRLGRRAWRPSILGLSLSNGPVPTSLLIFITGGTRGLGWALAREFVERGHRVAVCGRNVTGIERARNELPSSSLFAQCCDVSDAVALESFASAACAHFEAEAMHLWINNAGSVAQRGRMIDLPPAALREVIETNLLGTMLGCRTAARCMVRSGDVHGHIFNVDGAGVFGNGTPYFAAYGATKRAMPQLMRSLNREFASLNVSVHTFSPGMILTDLLLRDSTAQMRRFFNLLAERPETVAAFLAPRLVRVAQTTPPLRGTYIRYKTLPAAFGNIAWNALWPGRRYRFFDRNGNPVKPT
ncbi:hypothetical protein CCYA_CCYA05G1588 [Cyanidiococcus yangmingshanensis]|nr:hypothetical protein CCYA_CCYA05G1588 [Cyanidiococcus yangmingshanensis]